MAFVFSGLNMVCINGITDFWFLLPCALICAPARDLRLKLQEIDIIGYNQLVVYVLLAVLII